MRQAWHLRTCHVMPATHQCSASRVTAQKYCRVVARALPRAYVPGTLSSEFHRAIMVNSSRRCATLLLVIPALLRETVHEERVGRILQVVKHVPLHATVALPCRACQRASLACSLLPRANKLAAVASKTVPQLGASPKAGVVKSVAATYAAATAGTCRQESRFQPAAIHV